jgi:hypothetical protein
MWSPPHFYLPAEDSPLDARPFLWEVTAKVLRHKGYYNNFGDEFRQKNNFEPRGRLIETCATR